MHVISRRRLLEFWREHRDAESPLSQWYKSVSKATWQSIADVKASYSHADAAGDCTVFNIGGNKYRLITKIYYIHQTVLVRAVLTHKEYDEEKWNDDCYCYDDE